MVGYVCMTPRRMASKDTLQQRQWAFESGLSTSHWPHCNVRVPRIDFDGTIGDVVNDPSDINSLQRRLIGYDERFTERCVVM